MSQPGHGQRPARPTEELLAAVAGGTDLFPQLAEPTSRDRRRDAPRPEAGECKVDAFRWCSKWVDELQRVRVIVIERDQRGRRAVVRRCPNKQGEPLTHAARQVGGWLGRRVRNETGETALHLVQIVEGIARGGEIVVPGAGLPRSTVQRAIRELEQAGAIERQRSRRRNGKTVYKLLPLTDLRPLTDDPTGGPTAGPPTSSPSSPPTLPLLAASQQEREMPARGEGDWQPPTLELVPDPVRDSEQLELEL